MKTLIRKIEKLINNSKYDKAVEVVRDAFNIEFKAEFLKNDYHFTGDKDKRDIYKVTLKRGNRKYSFNFGQSIMNSQYYRDIAFKERTYTLNGSCRTGNYKITNIENYKTYVTPIKGKEPKLYDVLACLQKYEVGTFEDFCNEFGYDNDSISAKKTYKAVSKEYDKMCTLFNNDELEVLQYIQ